MADSTSADEPFSIRGFAARMRSVDAAKCDPFGGGCKEGEPPPPPRRLPPMDLPPRPRWWAHELESERARLADGAAGGAAAGGRGEEGGGGPRKGTKRKGSRGSTAAAERSKKRRRALQLRSLLKNKEKTCKPQSTSRFHQHMLHIGLLRKHRSSIHTTREIAPGKKSVEVWEQNTGGTDTSNDTHSSTFNRKAAHSFVNKRSVKFSGSTNYPLNPGCELVKHVSHPPSDDIFGDLPLLESSKIMFRTGVDEIPIVIEESFITNQSGPDAIPEAVPLKLMNASDITVQAPSLENFVKIEGTPEKEPTCSSQVDASRNQNHPFTAVHGGLPNQQNIRTVKTCQSDTQLKYADGSALSSYSDLRSKCSPSNPPRGCLDAVTNCRQEIKKHGASSPTCPSAVRTRTEATKSHKDAAVNDRTSTDISDPVVELKNHLSSECSVWSSTISQKVMNTGAITNGMSPCGSMPAKEGLPASRPSGNFASAVSHGSRKYMDACAPLSVENQGGWQSEVHPVCSRASIGSAFMKLPGLERMEISNCTPKTRENRFTNEQSMHTVTYQKQKLVSGMTDSMQGQQNICLGNSQARKKVVDGYVGQDVYNLQQPTVRLMGKMVSVCKRSKDHNLSTIGKACPENIVTDDHPSSISWHLPQKRLLPFQDPVIPTSHQNNSSDLLARIPNSTLSEKKTTFSVCHSQKVQPIRSAPPNAKGCTWNFSGQFVRQGELNKASVVSANSGSRHTGLQQPHIMSIPRNVEPHLYTPASHTEVHNFVDPLGNQPSSFTQEVLMKSMKEKYQKSTLSSYNDPSSVPIHQTYQIPGSKLSSAPIISFFGASNALSRNSSPALHSSLATSVSNKSVPATGPICIGSLTNTDGMKGTGSADEINSRPAYADNVLQKPAKRQLVTEQHDFMFMAPNHSLGWSLNDAVVGPRILDFSNRVAGDAAQTLRNESNNLRDTSDPIPAIETRLRSGFVAGAKTMLKPGQNLNDHSKPQYSGKFPVVNGINSVVL
ncbi:hypothetical protein ACP4OV_025115 [Aristida adscensionis]